MNPYDFLYSVRIKTFGSSSHLLPSVLSRKGLTMPCHLVSTALLAASSLRRRSTGDSLLQSTAYFRHSPLNHEWTPRRHHGGCTSQMTVEDSETVFGPAVFVSIAAAPPETFVYELRREEKVTTYHHHRLATSARKQRLTGSELPPTVPSFIRHLLTSACWSGVRAIPRLTSTHSFR